MGCSEDKPVPAAFRKWRLRGLAVIAVFCLVALVAWLWYTRQPVIEHTFQHGEAVYRLQFSANGQYLLAHGIGLMQVWDLLSNRPVILAEATPHAGFLVALLPDGRPFTDSDWEASKLQSRTRPQGPDPDRSAGPSALFMSADGRQMAEILTNGSIGILRGEGYTQRSQMARLAGFKPSTAKFSRDGRYVTAGSPAGRIVTWEISTGQPVSDWSTAITDMPLLVDVSEDGAMAVFGHGWSVTVASADAPGSPRLLHVFGRYVTSDVAFLDAAHVIAAAGHSGDLLVWDA